MSSERHHDPPKVSRLKPCPPKLASIIRDVNMLPPSLSLLSFRDAAALVQSRTPEGERFVAATEALEICLGHITEPGVRNSLEDFISRSSGVVHDNSTSALEDRIYRYEFFRVARLTLQSLARMNTLLMPIAVERGLSPHEGNDLVTAWFGGSLGPDEVARIKECLICMRVFWSGRSNQKCCSPRCNHIRHSRRTRERYREGYYQGARLTEKEQAEQRRARRKRNSTTRGKE